MRHSNSNRKFGREKKVRTALIKSLARSLIMHEGITTTEAKAKEIRPFVEKLLTLSRKGTASKRLISGRIGVTGAEKLVTVAEKYKTRNGGYTRIIKLGRRMSDGSPMARVEFV